MDDPTTVRFALPLLASGQAGKEWTHNEALALIDLALQPAVQAVGRDTPPAAPLAGQSWIVGTAPTGAWQGRAGCLAGWTASGWRFVAPREGFAAWSISTGRTVVYRDGLWQEGDVAARRLVIDGVPVVQSQGAAIADPSGGANADSEGRRAIGEMLAALRRHGLIAP
jgi:hypothetical protein